MGRVLVYILTVDVITLVPSSADNLNIVNLLLKLQSVTFFYKKK